MNYSRPTLRKNTIEQIKASAQKNSEGKYISPYTGKVIPEKDGKQVYDIGHKQGHEHWREAKKAEEEGLSREEFIERMNDPNKYQIEDRSENRSRKYEIPAQEQSENIQEQEEEIESSM